MADIVSNKKELLLISEYSDGSTTSAVIKAPKASIAAADISALAAINAQNGFVRYKSAVLRDIVHTDYDLS